jgi:protein TonB
VQIVVDEKGDVISAKAVSGHRSLHGASEKAARSAKFSPTVICGNPVKVTGLITYNFVLMLGGSR